MYVTQHIYRKLCVNQLHKHCAKQINQQHLYTKSVYTHIYKYSSYTCRGWRCGDAIRVPSSCSSSKCGGKIAPQQLLCQPAAQQQQLSPNSCGLSLLYSLPSVVVCSLIQWLTSAKHSPRKDHVTSHLCVSRATHRRQTQAKCWANGTTCSWF